MEPSTSDALLGSHHPWLTAAALLCAASAAAILLWYLIRRPPLNAATKVVLFLGLGFFPIGAAFTGNVVGFEQTTTRDFCGSCHVMEPYTNDAADPNSQSLAAIHSRNDLFGDRSCYTCHSDYGMFGTVVTKMAGLRHVYEYYTGFNELSIDEALPRIDLYEPFSNSTCTRCHSTTVSSWREQPDHLALGDDPSQSDVSCVSAGCHGPSHPFSKPVSEGGTL